MLLLAIAYLVPTAIILELFHRALRPGAFEDVPPAGRAPLTDP